MKFVLNNKEYESKPFDFEMMCELEERGFESENIGVRQNMLFMREVFAIWSGLSRKEAMTEINEQIVNNKEIGQFSEVLNKEMDESGFIKAILGMEETPQKSQKKEKE